VPWNLPKSRRRLASNPFFGVELRVKDSAAIAVCGIGCGYRNLNVLLSQKAESSTEDAAVATQQRQPVALDLLRQYTGGLIAISPDLSLAELFSRAFL